MLGARLLIRPLPFKRKFQYTQTRKRGFPTFIESRLRWLSAKGFGSVGGA